MAENFANTSSMRFRSHDFADNLQRTRDFLQNQDVVKDYDIDGTVMDIINSVLAEVTEKNSITGNTLYAESFIDTAQIRKNVAKHAKRYNYVPYSNNSAKAIVNVNIDVNPSLTSPPSTLTIPKGSVFSSTGPNGNTFMFSTITSYTAELQSNFYTFENIELYQGVYTSADIFIDKNKRIQVYEIPVDDINSSLLEVYVQTSIDSEKYEQWLPSTGIRANSESKIYFLQEVDDQRYGISFGDGVIGKEVNDRSIVRLVFITCDGEDGNFCRDFKFDFSPKEYDNLNVLAFTANVTTVERANGGFNQEISSSVARNAPRFFVNQNRAVIVKDYEDILTQRFPYINAISIWTGEKGANRYDQFGRVYLSANSNKSQILTDNQKSEIIDVIRNENGTSGVIPVIVDASVTYIDLRIIVKVDDLVQTNSSEIIESVREYAINYNKDNLSNFSGSFRHSKFVAGVDKLSDLIFSNQTDIVLSKRYAPTLQTNSSFSLSFHNSISNLYTNSFTYGQLLKKVVLRSDSSGSINIFELTSDNNEILLVSSVGSVDYETGDVTINELFVTVANDVTKDLRFFANPTDKDIYSRRNNILAINKIEPEVKRNDSNGST